MGRNTLIINKLTVEDYLKYKSEKVGDCILWTGCMKPKGYGHLGPMKWSKQYKVNMPHQLSYIINKGEYDRKLDICHTCHNRLCINPDHLYAGTRKQNMKDMYNAGRANHAVEFRNANCKLSNDEIKDIRIKLLTKSNQEVANEYNVSASYICNVKYGRRR